VSRTRLSLYYLAGYLLIGGVALLLAPEETLGILLSDGDYGSVFPRVAGMLMFGLGVATLGIIRARAEVLYPATLMIRAFFLACLAAFYWMTRDPLFLVLLGVVLLGVILTLTSYLSERKLGT
jgi:uncharacterized membrane protein YoaK (UPF0700 family)